jgi:hypothetical protein
MSEHMLETQKHGCRAAQMTHKQDCEHRMHGVLAPSRHLLHEQLQCRMRKLTEQTVNEQITLQECVTSIRQEPRRKGT